VYEFEVILVQNQDMIPQWARGANLKLRC